MTPMNMWEEYLGEEVEAMADEIASLPPARRVRLLELLRERFCVNCGEDFASAERHVCYFTNDERGANGG